MARGSVAQYRINKPDLKSMRDDLVHFMQSEGYTFKRKTLKDSHFILTAIQGNKLYAVLASIIPFARFFGIGSRVHVHIMCRKSLKKEDERYSLVIRCDPLMELFDEKETFFATQDLEEAFGDNLKCNRALKSIVVSLKQGGYLSE